MYSYENSDRVVSFSVLQSEGQLNSIHVDLIRGVGLLMLIWALSYWLLSKSTDSTIETSFVWIQAIVSYFISSPFQLCTGRYIQIPLQTVDTDKKVLIMI